MDRSISKIRKKHIILSSSEKIMFLILLKYGETIKMRETEGKRARNWGDLHNICIYLCIEMLHKREKKAL